jgi:hypothetical protein
LRCAAGANLNQQIQKVFAYFIGAAGGFFVGKVFQRCGEIVQIRRCDGGIRGGLSNFASSDFNVGEQFVTFSARWRFRDNGN